MNMYEYSDPSHMASSQHPYLVVQDVSVAYGLQTVLSNIRFSANEGEFISILGPSGSGKSTLLRVVAGLVTPRRGEIRFGSETCFSSESSVHKPPEQRDIGMVFQDFGLWPHLTVLDHVAFPLVSRKQRRRTGLSKREISERAMATLSLFRIAEFAKKRPHELSGGQQQRVAFARSIAARPRLVLLDEAFSAIDPHLRVEVREELLGILRQHRMTVLNVTHDQEEAMAVSDRVLVLRQGSQLQFSSAQDIYEQPANRFVASFVGKGSFIPVTVDRNGMARLPDEQVMDILQAQVRGVAGQEPAGLSTIQVRDSCPAPEQPGEGGPLEACLLLRPEFVRVRDTQGIGQQGCLTWHGHVTRQVSLIGRTELYVEVAGIGEVCLYHHERLEIGDRVELEVQVSGLQFIRKLD